MSWCTIESDPGVFSELIKRFGVEDVAVEEIFSLDASMEVFEEGVEAPTHGLIFLFKWKASLSSDNTGAIDLDETPMPDLYFARQTVQNACATQAILSVLLNSPSISVGPVLANLKDFSISLDPASRGMVIGNTEEIRIAHNSFGRPETFMPDAKPIKGAESEDVYHFISYIPFNGMVYELDGLKRGPIPVGPIPEGVDWLSVARPAVQSRMATYAANETHFALMKIVRRPMSVLEEALSLKMSLPDSPENAAACQELRDKIEDEVAKETRYALENVRRRHNYLPLAFSLFNLLASKGKLQELRDAARQRSINNSAARKK